MVQKYQNEIAPIFYYGISTKTNEKDLKIPNLQPPDWKSPYWMTLYEDMPWLHVIVLMTLMFVSIFTMLRCPDCAKVTWHREQLQARPVTRRWGQLETGDMPWLMNPVSSILAVTNSIKMSSVSTSYYVNTVNIYIFTHRIRCYNSYITLHRREIKIQICNRDFGLT